MRRWRFARGQPCARVTRCPRVRDVVRPSVLNCATTPAAVNPRSRGVSPGEEYSPTADMWLGRHGRRGETFTNGGTNNSALLNVLKVCASANPSAYVLRAYRAVSREVNATAGIDGGGGVHGDRGSPIVQQVRVSPNVTGVQQRGMPTANESAEPAQNCPPAACLQRARVTTCGVVAAG